MTLHLDNNQLVAIAGPRRVARKQERGKVMTKMSILIMPVHYTYGGIDYTAEVRDGSGWSSMMRFIETEAQARDWAERTAEQRRITLAAQAARRQPLPMNGTDYHHYNEE